MSKKISKNNASNRGPAAVLLKLNGREVEPVLYYNHEGGYRKYMAAQYVGSDELVLDSKGNPVPYSSIIGDSANSYVQ